jgi:hypothetical protein
MDAHAESEATFTGQSIPRKFHYTPFVAVLCHDAGAPIRLKDR